MSFRVTSRRSSLFVLPTIPRASACLAKHELSPRLRVPGAGQRAAAAGEMRRHPMPGLRRRVAQCRQRECAELDLIVCSNASRHGRPPVRCARSQQPESRLSPRPARAGGAVGAHGRKLSGAARCCTVRML